ncbi:MAG: ABC transporter permease [Anaerolineales bacterium]|nr:ABC transporter permease [Anaerolineales bacterium]
MLLNSAGSALWSIVVLTFEVTGMALAISAILGIPVGALIALARFPGRRWAVALIYTGMGLPPVVVGLAVYLLLSRSGPLGDLGWLFTPAAMVVAQTVIAVPLVVGLTMTSIESLDPQLRLQVRALGADQNQEMRALLAESRQGVVAAMVAGFGSIISEVGAAMLVGGNIEGQTRILSTAIVLETRQGEFGLALALGGVLLSLTFLVNALLMRLQNRTPWWPGR